MYLKFSKTSKMLYKAILLSTVPNSFFNIGDDGAKRTTFFQFDIAPMWLLQFLNEA